MIFGRGSDSRQNGCFLFYDGLSVKRIEQKIREEAMNSQKKIKADPSLDAEELALERELAAGQWKEAAENISSEIVEAARQSLGRRNREARINVRVTRETLQLLQTQAQEEGVGYQTLIGSVLHKYAHGKLVNTDDVQKILPMLDRKKLGAG
jgi:predicted DNA binding CopG/RHH family protein